MRRCLFYIALVPLLLLTGCGNDGLPEPSSDPVSETTGYQPVVMVEASVGNKRFPSSGVFVSPNVILTVSHAVPNGTKSLVFNNQRDLWGRANLVTKLTGNADGRDPSDVALLKITASNRENIPYYPIAKSIAEGDTVRLVGFGSFRNEHDRRKRTGTNVIFRLTDMLELSFANPVSLRGASNRAGGTPGDSGGPLLKMETNEVVGLIQSRDPDGPITYGVNLTRPEIKTWLSEANRNFDLKIPGI